jgi:hypothetical protein
MDADAFASMDMPFSTPSAAGQEIQLSARFFCIFLKIEKSCA